MVCPNCKSDEIIAVQNQHFCINCGQMVPESLYAKPASESAPVAASASAVKLQPNGLPEGVKILPLAPSGKTKSAAASPAPAVPTGNAEPAGPVSASAAPALIHGRSRFSAAPAPAPAVAKRRKPGRPKAGRLDVPSRIIPASPAERAAVMAKEVEGTPTPPVPVVKSAKLPASPLPPLSSGPRRLNDLAPRRPSAPPPAPAAAVTAINPTDRATGAVNAGKSTKLPKPPKPAKSAKPAKFRRHAHRVGVPALHYQPVLTFSLRARTHPRYLALASLGALALGVAAAYGAWQFMHGGLPGLADSLLQAGPKLIGEVALLALIYYIGRSLGQAAITYGISREADQRPVSLSRQFGIAVNTFARRVRLDAGFLLAELLVVGAGVMLFYTGGSPWPINANFQIASVFMAYLALLYLWMAVVLARGLAGVNLTLTTDRPGAAARIGWQLFSHRLELIGPRFMAIVMEAVLAVPLLGLTVALILATPTSWHAVAIVGAGLLSWLAGTLLGVGTASWWAMLYRQLVTADRPHEVMTLLSSRQPEDAHRLPLAVIIAISTFLISAGLVWPWLSLF